jgi:hypothetical protein
MGACHGRGFRGGARIGGDTGVVVGLLVTCSSTAPFGGVERRVVGGLVVVSILLGPEGTSLLRGFLRGGCCPWVLACPAAANRFRHGCVWGRCCGCGWVGLFVENCIVDASIFVVKLVRANGGCLGTRSR